MQYHWLNKQNNDKLIVFFAGWSFDYKPFEFLNCGDCDVLFVYDYSEAKQLCSLAAKLEDWRAGGQEGKLVCHCEENAEHSTWQSRNFDIEKAGLLRFARNDSLNEILQSQKPDTDLFAYSLIRLFAFYSKKSLLSWSMGTYVAYKMRDLFKDFDKKIAVNGTPFPVDNEYGIPEKPFLLTLKHAKTGLEGKFYQNIFDKEEEYERYLKNPVERPIENRVEELQDLYENIKNTQKNYEPFFDKAFVSLNDKIIPSKNQLKFWNDFNVPVETLDSGHFPYYNFNSWKEFL